MRILSLYIDSFGTLSNYTCDFNAEMNNIYEENGWGKTTLTVFIKSMLYGLNNKQERIRYTPWTNLSSFGGSLFIEVDQKKYRIDRTFNPQKASLDTFKIYDLQTNTELVNYPNNLGEKFLNLSEGSFERSVYIPQKDLEEGFGSDIEAKLANLIGGTNDSQTFDEAIVILKNKTKELRLNSKKGLILDKKKELDLLENELTECVNKMDGISTIQSEIKEINEKINALVEEKKQVNQKIINYTREQDKKVKLEIAKKYQEDINNTKKSLDENNQIFNNQNITVDDVLAIRAKNKELINLKTEYELKKGETRIIDKLSTLKEDFNFGGKIPSEEEISKIGKKIEKIQNIKNMIAVHTAEPEKKKPIGGIILLIFSTLILITGVSFLVLSSIYSIDYLIPGCIISGISVIGYIFSVILFIITNSHNNNLDTGKVRNYDFESRSLEEEIREFFGRYHLYSSDFSNNLYIIRSNAAKYREAMNEYDDLNEENNRIKNKICELEEIVMNFIKRFNTTAQTFEEKIGELNTHLRKKDELQGELIKKEMILKQYISLNKLDNISEEKIDLDVLNSKILQIDDQITEYNNDKTTLSNKIIEYESDITKYDELSMQREVLIEEIKNLENEYNILNLTIEYLSNSQKSLLEKYVSPMKESANKYVSLLLKNNSEYSIDVNFKFQFITNSGLKGIDLYSRGYQAIISLCMRLALIDCLYPNEKPFVIFDDPFVNFDDEKLEQCKNLIIDISKKYQILYFTCHDSRLIK
ncbi:MAG: ATP-binding protein [Anaeroplasma sp.]